MAETLLGKAAVTEKLPEHPAVKALGELITDAKFDRGELTLTVASDNIVAALKAVQAAGYNAFQDMTAVDWYPSTPRFQLSYHIQSHQFKEVVRLRVLVDEADASVESITRIWPGANYYEREVFDLFGIRFENHPNLRRILMPDDWVGHPLRKDYPVEGYR
ncbi:NADH-quinone oxidoreductase subunit C [Terracidiphilus gabretensis]|uniref:NADH-quinone oxidoreductase subunit C n=1 Tax=Terracidiphilus gabretensis TaxID=1577687 RepID=UPI00071B4DF0|nr:NADH-quinone oxidoreductase subunit C [Terracidiphilus gabretensis]